MPLRAADAFVTKVFDSFAADFDEVLHRLEYRAPALVGMDVQRIDGEPRANLDVMDARRHRPSRAASAPLCTPPRRRDLSLKMLEKAASRAVYDQLVAAELTRTWAHRGTRSIS